MVDETMANVKFAELTWTRAFKVWWSLVWRGMLFGFLAGGIAGAIIGFIMGGLGVNPDIIATSTRIAGMIIGIPIGIAVTKIVLKKQYSDFRIALVKKE